ncbi:hypothetical protein F4778DRAFT_637520 [Xylariomycetidae sp. FL2044]|nr:hypothetical protein F4778DRAFT_637520 [Xylariomycetidae sp. FL2044]
MSSKATVPTISNKADKTDKTGKTDKADKTAQAAVSAATSNNDDKKVLRQQAAALGNRLYCQIKKQMKWVPSCRRGTARWSYTTGVADPAVFFKLFRLSPTDAKGKKWKQKRVLVTDFEDCVGEIHASIRYGSLKITGTHVTVKWDEEDSVVTVSGRYGL